MNPRPRSTIAMHSAAPNSSVPASFLRCAKNLVGASSSASPLQVAPCGIPIKYLGCELPDRFTVPLDQLVVHSNFELPSQHRLLQEINSERVDVSSKLNLPDLGRKNPRLPVQRIAAVLRLHPSKVPKLSRPPRLLPRNRHTSHGLRLLGRPRRRRSPPRSLPRLSALDGPEPAAMARRRFGQIF